MMMMTMRGLKAAVATAVLSASSMVYGLDASSRATVSLPLQFHDQDGQLILTVRYSINIPYFSGH